MLCLNMMTMLRYVWFARNESCPVEAVINYSVHTSGGNASKDKLSLGQE